MTPFTFSVVTLANLLLANAATTCEVEGTCQSSPQMRRIGAVMIQTQTAPHHHKRHASQSPRTRTGKAHGDGLDEQLMLPLQERVAAIDARVTSLETKSGEGREALRSGLDALKAATESVGLEKDAAVAQVTAAEGELSALEGVVNQNSADLRGEVDRMRTEFKALGKKVFKTWSAMLQAWLQDTPAASGEDLFAQVATLDGRVQTLEQASGEGRLQLKDELDALEAQVANIREGGEGSLKDARSRATAAETQINSLASAVDQQGTDLQRSLDSLTQQLQALSREVGHKVDGGGGGGESAGSLLVLDMESSTNRDDPAAGGGSGGGSGAMSIRIDSLETRTTLLEAKSNIGRGDLQKQLDRVTNALAEVKDGGAIGLANTVVRLTEVDANVANLKTKVDEQKTSITAAIATFEAMLKGLSGHVGQ